jgi:hypothetical protein
MHGTTGKREEKSSMALHGKFVVDNKPLSPLSIFGVGVFMAFSGDDIYRNRGGCTAIKDRGPIPAGRYWIVDRPTGGIGSRVKTWIKDAGNSVLGSPTNRNDWFALYRDDGKIDDYTWLDGVERGNFRLHPMGYHGVSLGCITLPHLSEFYAIRRALLRTDTVLVPNTSLRAYGVVEVIAHGKTCP